MPGDMDNPPPEAFTRTVDAPLDRTPAGAPTRWSGLNCSVLFCDVAGFGDPSRDDEDRRVVRDVTYGILLAALEASDVPLADTYREDRGDGALVIVSPAVPTASLVDPLAGHLAVALRRHNHRASAAVRVQLRVALHVGPVTPDAEGLNGQAIIQTARLLEAPVLKAALADRGADLGFIVSPFVYDAYVAHLHGALDPAAFERVTLKVKETATEAWMYLTGTATPPARRSPDPHGPQGTTVFSGDVQIRGDLVLGNKITHEH
ncbi:hypothetical protein [Actinomadura bangladeshensis]|uniref:Guanylate cyclase domain-containing protein n=1 Tax=Actinomadura bangladeshensis TaxID=453573 RepID=A0A6L9QWE0_9ACTN|nr:hypothetical protein [Actinomadura bangladeshensis]NEA29526.1 hypothetical protein [Actinomadura bangladeshensis]